MRRSWLRKREANDGVVVAAAVVAVAAVAAVLDNKYKKNGKGKETRQFRELKETSTDLEDDERHSQIDKERQIDFKKKIIDYESISILATTIAKIKDPEVNENQRQQRSELKNLISFIQYDSNTQTNLNLDFNDIRSQCNTPHKSLSPHPQQHLTSPTQEESLAILRT
ncbi:MAG: hypothetical protein EZS28_052430, partial [Streblomastix strix]